MRGLNTVHPGLYCSNTILNHQLTQKLKLVDEDRFNIISNKIILNILGFCGIHKFLKGKKLYE